MSSYNSARFVANDGCIGVKARLEAKPSENGGNARVVGVCKLNCEYSTLASGVTPGEVVSAGVARAICSASIATRPLPALREDLHSDDSSGSDTMLGMRLRPLFVIVFAGLLSCFSRAQFDRAHAQRVQGINTSADEKREEVIEECSSMRSQIKSFKKFLIPVRESSGYTPVDRVEERDDVVQALATCKPAGDPNDEQVKLALQKCVTEWQSDIYVPALVKRYFRADTLWVAQQWSQAGNKGDIEALLAYSHNTSVLAYIKQHLDEIDSLMEQRLQDVEQERSAEITSSEFQRDSEIAEAEARHRARMAAIGAALQGMAQGMSQASAQRPYSPVPVYGGAATTPTTHASCTSDFTCGIGYTCVKGNYSSEGFCAKAVDSYGVQTFDLPDLNSVGPKFPVSTDCKFMTDCPAGFRCDTKSGACFR